MSGAVTFAPAVPLVRFERFGSRVGFVSAAHPPVRRRNILGGTILVGHRTVAGGRKARRPALAAALVGLVLAGAGLVPAIAANQGSGTAGGSGAPARTGAGRSGTAITIVAPIDQKAVGAIEKLIGQTIEWAGAPAPSPLVLRRSFLRCAGSRRFGPDPFSLRRD